MPDDKGYKHHRPPDLNNASNTRSSFLKPARLNLNAQKTQEQAQASGKASKKTPESKQQRTKKTPEPPQRLSRDILNRFSEPKDAGKGPLLTQAKRKAENRTKSSPPQKNAKNLSKGKMNLSGNISADDLDPLEELVQTVMKANQIKAATKQPTEISKLETGITQQPLRSTDTEGKKKSPKTPPGSNVLMEVECE